MRMVPWMAPSAPHTRPTQQLSRPPPIQNLGAENRMLQLVWYSWWWAYVPETCRPKNTSIKLPCCIKLAFHIISAVQLSWIQAALADFQKSAPKGPRWGKTIRYSRLLSGTLTFLINVRVTFLFPCLYHHKHLLSYFISLLQSRWEQTWQVPAENTGQNIGTSDHRSKRADWYDVIWSADLGVVWFKTGCHSTSSLLQFT